ncbi:MAG TPA: BofC C-terminal domain-containing protein [Caproiciproducens sp.]|nr:BofC C-terminal domain-containing protein [Caproiciproducens sp.]
MKKSVAAILLIAAVFLVILLYVRYPKTQPSSPSLSSKSVSSNIIYNSTPIASSSQESSEINAMVSNLYIVKEYQGIIGVFYNNDTSPFRQIDVDVATLPQADQKALKTGIKVFSMDKLNQIIEDYES